MSIFDDIQSGFEEVGNAVTGAANTVGNGVVQTAESFGDSAYNYAIIVGDGVASAGQVIGDGVVTFGTSVESFSVSASGTAFNWLKTSAYDVENWTLGYEEMAKRAGMTISFNISRACSPAARRHRCWGDGSTVAMCRWSATLWGSAARSSWL